MNHIDVIRMDKFLKVFPFETKFNIARQIGKGGAESEKKNSSELYTTYMCSYCYDGCFLYSTEVVKS